MNIFKRKSKTTPVTVSKTEKPEPMSMVEVVRRGLKLKDLTSDQLADLFDRTPACMMHEVAEEITRRIS